jgi:hypothetical protein
MRGPSAAGRIEEELDVTPSRPSSKAARSTGDRVWRAALDGKEFVYIVAVV